MLIGFVIRFICIDQCLYVYTDPGFAHATNFTPSEDDATDDQTLDPADICSVQSTPLFELVYIFPPSTQATRLTPSAEDATETQFLIPEFVCSIHIDPKLELVYIYPLYTHATNFTPSEEHATEYHFFCPAVDSVHDVPEFELVNIRTLGSLAVKLFNTTTFTPSEEHAIELVKPNTVVR